MACKEFPIIDPVATGKNIEHLREKRKLSVRDVQEYFGFQEPQAIYQWQRGKTVPSVDHLCALSKLFEVSMDEILVLVKSSKGESKGSNLVFRSCQVPKTHFKFFCLPRFTISKMK